MFSLQQNQNKKKSDVFLQIEEDMKDTATYAKMDSHLTEKIKDVKNRLRSGVDQAIFDTLSTLLQGYTAMQEHLKILNTKY